eukprot:scaffold12543_cov115-Isochrysis_galbana.AAC.13
MGGVSAPAFVGVAGTRIVEEQGRERAVRASFRGLSLLATNQTPSKPLRNAPFWDVSRGQHGGKIHHGVPQHPGAEERLVLGRGQEPRGEESPMRAAKESTARWVEDGELLTVSGGGERGGRLTPRARRRPPRRRPARCPRHCRCECVQRQPRELGHGLGEGATIPERASIIGHDHGDSGGEEERQVDREGRGGHGVGPTVRAHHPRHAGAGAPAKGGDCAGCRLGEGGGWREGGGGCGGRGRRKDHKRLSAALRGWELEPGDATVPERCQHACTHGCERWGRLQIGHIRQLSPAWSCWTGSHGTRPQLRRARERRDRHQDVGLRLRARRLFFGRPRAGAARRSRHTGANEPNTFGHAVGKPSPSRNSSKVGSPELASRPPCAPSAASPPATTSRLALSFSPSPLQTAAGAAPASFAPPPTFTPAPIFTSPSPSTPPSPAAPTPSLLPPPERLRPCPASSNVTARPAGPPPTAAGSHSWTRSSNGVEWPANWWEAWAYASRRPSGESLAKLDTYPDDTTHTGGRSGGAAAGAALRSVRRLRQADSPAPRLGRSESEKSSPSSLPSKLGCTGTPRHSHPLSAMSGSCESKSSPVKTVNGPPSGPDTVGPKSAQRHATRTESSTPMVSPNPRFGRYLSRADTPAGASWAFETAKRPAAEAVVLVCSGQ